MRILCACRCGGRISKPRQNKGKRGGRKFIPGHSIHNAIVEKLINIRGGKFIPRQGKVKRTRRSSS
jgi:hypothetical protein